MPGHPRRDTAGKHVYLSLETTERITAWAALQGMNFSAALETLAQLGLKDAPPLAYAAPLEAAVRGTIKAELGRVTALLASSAIDGHVSYLLGLAAAKRDMAAEQYQGLKQAARLTARDVVRQRATREGQEHLVALLTGHADDELDD